MVKKLILCGVLAFMFVGTSLAAPTAAGPKSKVQGTVDAIIGVLKDKSLKPAVSRQKIADLIKVRFNFKAMSQRTLGPYWRDTPAAQQDQFKTLYAKMLIALYMDRIQAYTDQKVKYLNEFVQDNNAMVDTEIITKKGPIPIKYRLSDKSGDWLVNDVLIEGVSLIHNYQMSYRDIIQREGMKGLLTRMQAKIKELENTQTAAKS